MFTKYSDFLHDNKVTFTLYDLVDFLIPYNPPYEAVSMAAILSCQRRGSDGGPDTAGRGMRKTFKLESNKYERWGYTEWHSQIYSVYCMDAKLKIRLDKAGFDRRIDGSGTNQRGELLSPPSI
jgi:hypothetical protein